VLFLTQNAMEHSEFAIGCTFWCGEKAWGCTDIGTRVITAIRLDRDADPSWYNGPPYTVAEVVFDEYDTEACTLERQTESKAE